MPAAIKTTESIKNFRPFTAERAASPRRRKNERERKRQEGGG
jgi:hypothetical protein